MNQRVVGGRVRDDADSHWLRDAERTASATT